MKKQYTLKTGDIIRIYPELSRFFGNSQFLKTVVDNAGIYHAYTIHGKFVAGFPVDIIQFIKIDGVWWKIYSAKCQNEEAAPSTFTVFYEVTDEFDTSIIPNLENALSELLKG